MVRSLTTHDIRELLQKVGIEVFLLTLIERVKSDFSRWNEFDKTPRIANHYPHGVIELMPISDQNFYSFKYVNGHPNNPADGNQTVVAMGLLADVKSGYPLMVSEMTLLTALRTAATSALASQLLARKNSKTLALIGTGAQSEFQTFAHHAALGIERVQFFDVDPQAMVKFESNMSDLNIELVKCTSTSEAVKGADIVVTCTADKKQAIVLSNDDVVPGMHVSGLGGDCPGKTELDSKILPRAKLVVEFFEQSFIEGEIQHFSEAEAKKLVYAEMWELVNQAKPGRESDDEITVFDSVGFAIEDYSVLRAIYDLAEEHDIGKVEDFVPPISDPKNLYGFLTATPMKVGVKAESKVALKREG